MISTRKMAALRALAERPGTEAEGRVARAKLAELEAMGPADDPHGLFAVYLRTGSMSDLYAACGAARAEGVRKELHQEAARRARRFDDAVKAARLLNRRGTKAGGE